MTTYGTISSAGGGPSAIVTVDNAAGAAAVNIQDGGNSITVDGTVAVTGVATAANQTTEIASLANLDVALSTRLKAADTLNALTTLGTITNVVHVDDNAGSLTVDGTVAATIASLPLPANAAQESSGNLALLVALTAAIESLAQLQRLQLGTMKAIFMQLFLLSGTGVDLDEITATVLPQVN